ncbi:hypothetical protein [Advenella sp. EE-W14]|uniref:hypothetical protein n=1 Tax=Advenella sp. EE-W14 TaxID=2722705 RepID=UPI00145E67D7|nr:hypothetical protein [Advenella sp. EE-W14]
MKKRFFIPLFLFTPLALTILSLIYGKNLSFNSQKEIYNSLLTISSIILTIIGIWIAIVFPDKLKITNKINKQINNNENIEIGRFFKPLIYSTIVIIFSFLSILIGSILKSIPWVLEYKEIGRSLSLSILTALSFISIYSLYLTIALANTIKSNSDENDHANDIRHLYVNPENEISEFEIRKIKDPD